MHDGFSWTIMMAAVGIAVLHTVLGPDHTLPFIMLAKARRWSMRKTIAITLVCGAGHVGSSLVLGSLGLAVGYGVGQFEVLEGLRGSLAAWLMVVFGFAYALWGLRIALRRRAGIVPHDHEGKVHIHAGGHHHHNHMGEDLSATTFWMLFTVFVLGPCEPLIPFFMVPASRGDWGLAVVTGAAFSIATLATMVALVALGVAGFRKLPLGGLERWAHALTGTVIASSGLAVIFLGL
jgi:hypothetical protein